MDKVNILYAVEINNNRVKRFEGKKRYLATGDLSNQGIGGFTYVNYENKPSRADLMVEKGNLILARMKETNKVYLIEQDSEDIIVSTGFLTLRPKNSFEGKYLYHYFRSDIFQRSKDGLCSGATQKAINNNSFKTLKVPYYQIENQRNIAQILDTADNLRQKRKEQLTLLDNYLKSVFLDIFSDPVKNSKGWSMCKVIDVCDCIVPGRDKPKSFSGDIPWITTDDLVSLGWTQNSKKKMGLTLDEIATVKAKIIPQNSVVMTCVGDLGFVSIAKNEFVMNQQLHAFICSEKICNVFLMYNLFFQKVYMVRMASSTTVPYMNKTICNSVPILLPPIELQNKFTLIVKQIEQTKQKMYESLDEMDNHFNALMQRYFG